MGWETWTHRRRRVAELFTKSRVPLCGGRYELPYCGRGITPFPSDYVLSPWAPFTVQPVRSLFPGSFVDVGSNIGQTMLFIKDCDANWDYIGFEPNPNCFVVAKQIAEANALEGCTPRARGIVRSIGSARTRIELRHGPGRKPDQRLQSRKSNEVAQPCHGSAR